MAGIKLTDLYSGTAPTSETQEVAAPVSPSNTTAVQAPAVNSHAVAFSWLGLLIALILLRIIYEVAQ